MGDEAERLMAQIRGWSDEELNRLYVLLTDEHARRMRLAEERLAAKWPFPWDQNPKGESHGG